MFVAMMATRSCSLQLSSVKCPIVFAGVLSYLHATWENFLEDLLFIRTVFCRHQV